MRHRLLCACDFHDFVLGERCTWEKRAHLRLVKSWRPSPSSERDRRLVSITHHHSIVNDFMIPRLHFGNTYHNHFVSSPQLWNIIISIRNSVHVAVAETLLSSYSWQFRDTSNYKGTVSPSPAAAPPPPPPLWTKERPWSHKQSPTIDGTKRPVHWQTLSAKTPKSFLGPTRVHPWLENGKWKTCSST